MNEVELLVELHINSERQGPGGTKETIQALSLLGLDTTKRIKIADIGCGTGAVTIDLAMNTNAELVAVDVFPQFLEKLSQRANHFKLLDRITPLCESMDELSFSPEFFDVIWSEGAIYIMGFKKGLSYWKNFLKQKGYIVVSEVSWITNTRPGQIERYWKNAYPEIDTVSNKMKALEECGFSPVGFFTLPEHCWMDNYYLPLQSSMAHFLEHYQHEKQAKKVVEEHIDEIELYKRYKDYYTYGFYLAQKIK